MRAARVDASQQQVRLSTVSPALAVHALVRAAGYQLLNGLDDVLRAGVNHLAADLVACHVQAVLDAVDGDDALHAAHLGEVGHKEADGAAACRGASIESLWV